MKRALFFTILLMPMFLFGQIVEKANRVEPKPKSEFGIYLGLSNSGTDVHSWGKHGEGLFAKAHLAYGLNFTYNFTHHLGLRLNYTGTKISGDDVDITELAGHDKRAYNFKSPLHELGAFLQWDYNGYDVREDGTLRRFSPYLIAGVALSYTKPDVFWNEANVSHDSGDIDNVKSTYFQIPVGVGVKYNVSEKMFLGFEFRNIFPLSDYLDGISLSADPNSNDSYTFFGVNVGFKLGKSDRDNDGIADEFDSCPDIPGIVEFDGCPDSDGDGIMDKEDKCPLVAGLTALSGCPDSDGDGVADMNDDCPNKAGLAKFGGCPDSDGDGIMDKEDKCPNTKGLRKYMGCTPPDSDGDGVADDVDMCPNVKGTIKGCPDTDGDGVIDKDDSCPTVKGTVKGCPDRDGDGIADKDDNCPSVKGVASNGGCPVSMPIPNWSKDLYFNTASAGLDRQAQLDVKEIVRISKEYPNAKFMISGYTDDRGAESMNQRLSERRAKTVYNILIKKGIAAARMSYAGYGELNPKYPNGKNGNKLNRRVEVRFR